MKKTNKYTNGSYTTMTIWRWWRWQCVVPFNQNKMIDRLNDENRMEKVGRSTIGLDIYNQKGHINKPLAMNVHYKTTVFVVIIWVFTYQIPFKSLWSPSLRGFRFAGWFCYFYGWFVAFSLRQLILFMHLWIVWVGRCALDDDVQWVVGELVDRPATHQVTRLRIQTVDLKKILHIYE